ncbi:hypothetical protein DSM106972_023280 [Dulcicalothrix desertica PCC 7102]|uniref:DUF4058 domain-containing protein n=1 Tax=Dulcicalothrix desertica PCC 7102 TaxID=232991 RepID=A0A3S1J3I2_9CYAN|nr:DUF4058 family protein [Dulcicalothrix desertica]RUT07067.1 hypothetical protein DSM106972_023280 [Dulcicalothrix desertica PCC 7102]TWH61935.1 uncharacterized protein DUF4058 [Dulcicalothrix desertica PCC 7102]
MLSPFPGMNPYLEDPDLWAEVHHWLITLIANNLVPQLRPKYRVAIEKRVYQTVGEEIVLVGIPDVSVGRSKTDSNDKTASTVAVASPEAKPVTVTIPMPEEEREGYLEVREVETGAVVTTIEILSPKNKCAGDGRKAYETKRQKVLSSETHLVEIDLLRGGKPMPIVGRFINSSYRILVSRSNYRPKAELYPFELTEPIPSFPLPLRQGDTEPLLSLQTLIQEVYDRAGLDMAIDYTRKPIPELSEADETWADNLLRQQGLR